LSQGHNNPPSLVGDCEGSFKRSTRTAAPAALQVQVAIHPVSGPDGIAAWLTRHYTRAGPIDLHNKRFYA